MNKRGPKYGHMVLAIGATLVFLVTFLMPSVPERYERFDSGLMHILYDPSTGLKRPGMPIREVQEFGEGQNAQVTTTVRGEIVRLEIYKEDRALLGWLTVRYKKVVEFHDGSFEITFSTFRQDSF